MQKGFEKTIAEYKEANVELQKNVGVEPATTNLSVDPETGRKASKTSSFVPMNVETRESVADNSAAAAAAPVLLAPEPERVRKPSKMASIFTVWTHLHSMNCEPDSIGT